MSDETTQAAAEETTAAPPATEEDTRAAALALLEPKDAETEAPKEEPKTEAKPAEVKKPNRVFAAVAREREKLKTERAALETERAALEAERSEVADLAQLKAKIEAAKGDDEATLALLDALGVDLVKVAEHKLTKGSSTAAVEAAEKKIAAAQARLEALEKQATEREQAVNEAARSAERAEAERSFVGYLKDGAEKYPHLAAQVADEDGQKEVVAGAHLAVDALRAELKRDPTADEVAERMESNAAKFVAGFSKRFGLTRAQQAAAEKAATKTLGNAVSTSVGVRREPTDEDNRRAALKLLEQM